MAAEYVLKQVYGNDDAKISEYEKRFINKGKGSIMCNDLRGQCRACDRCGFDIGRYVVMCIHNKEKIL